MATRTQIANIALSYIGGITVADVDTEDSTEARLCRANLDQAIKEMLQTARWSFALTMTELTQLTETPPYRWTSAWQLPNDFVRLVEIAGTDAFHPDEWFQIQGTKLYLLDASYSSFEDTQEAKLLADSCTAEAASYSRPPAR